MLNLSQPEDVSYLCSLSMLGIDHIEQEPRRLRHEMKRISNDIDNLAVNNYIIHVQNHKCVRHLKEEVVLGIQSKHVNHYS